MPTESCSLGRERKLGGKFHLRLIISPNPIANKYHEGKVESTLERELDAPETVTMEAIGISKLSESGLIYLSVF